MAWRTFRSSVGALVTFSAQKRGTPVHGFFTIASSFDPSRRGKSCAGTASTICVSPDSTVAMRVAFSGMNFQMILSR